MALLRFIYAPTILSRNRTDMYTSYEYVFDVHKHARRLVSQVLDE